jgi:hypothetical protein
MANFPKKKKIFKKDNFFKKRKKLSKNYSKKDKFSKIWTNFRSKISLNFIKFLLQLETL